MNTAASANLFAPLHLMLVDDEPPALLRLQALLEDIAATCPTIVVAKVHHAQAALDVLVQTPHLPIDAILLDIEMPGMRGLELARHLHAVRQPDQPVPAIIFTTAYDQHALAAFELQAVDYLMKPVRASRLQEALLRVARQRSARAPHPMPEVVLHAQRAHLAIHQRGKLVLVQVTEIVYFKAELKYVTVRTRQAEYLLEEALTALEEEFSGLFIRVHRNALVARSAIQGFVRAKNPPDLPEGAADKEKNAEGHWEVMLLGVPEHLPISRRQWSAVKALFGNKLK